MKTCKICNVKKPWKYLKTAKDGRWIYVDDLGKRWNGLRCPECFISYLVEQRRKRKSKKD